MEILDRTRARERARTARLVFTAPDGGPMLRHRWTRIWRPAATAAGLESGSGLHELRHLYASMLIRQGHASIKTVQRALGHASATVTLDVYAHIWPDAHEQVRDAVTRGLGADST